MSLVGRIIDQIKELGRSSALRLALLLSVVFAVGFAVAITIALALGRDSIEGRVDETLDAFAGSISAADAEDDSPSMVLRPMSDLGDLPQPFVRAARDGGGTVRLERDFLRADIWRLRVTEDADGLPVVAAVPLEESEDARELLSGILWTTAATVVGLALAIGLGAGLLAQRRLRMIDATLDRLAAGDLTARTGQTRSRDDLDDIARRLDDTASALERLVTQTRHLSASLAHDLRTPLARLQSQLELLPASDQRGAALEEAARLSGIFDTIMRVARIEAAQGRDGFEAVDLGELATDLAETFGPVVEDAGKRLTLDVTAPDHVSADRGMIVQAVANLIQNALVHGGSDIRLFVDAKRLGVSDNGAGVDPEQFADIIKPMVRLDSARSTDGSGLGLALVRAVADRHGAQLTLAPCDPHGLKVSLNFAEL